MLLEKLINPKPTTTLIFVVFSVIFLVLPFVLNSTLFYRLITDQLDGR